MLVKVWPVRKLSPFLINFELRLSRILIFNVGFFFLKSFLFKTAAAVLIDSHTFQNVDYFQRIQFVGNVVFGKTNLQAKFQSQRE